MPELPFIARGDAIKHKVHPIGIKAFEHSVKEISSTMIHYLGEMDKFVPSRTRLEQSFIWRSLIHLVEKGKVLKLTGS